MQMKKVLNLERDMSQQENQSRPNMMATPTPWDLVAAGYAQTTMQLLAQFAEVAVASASLTPNMKVLDVACGPGTVSLMAAPQVASVSALDFSENMLTALAENMQSHGIENIESFHGNGQALPYQDNSFDAAFSMFGLMFFPERCKGFSEIFRVLKQGGKITVSSWAPIADSPAMQMMFGALRAMNPDVPEPQADIASLENPAVFHQELEDAGFSDVVVERVQKSIPVKNIQAFWVDMVRGSAPLVMMKQQWGEKKWAEKEVLALAYLQENLPQVPCELTFDAWLGSGFKL